MHHRNRTGDGPRRRHGANGSRHRRSVYRGGNRRKMTRYATHRRAAGLQPSEPRWLCVSSFRASRKTSFSERRVRRGILPIIPLCVPLRPLRSTEFMGSTQPSSASSCPPQESAPVLCEGSRILPRQQYLSSPARNSHSLVASKRIQR